MKQLNDEQTALVIACVKYRLKKAIAALQYKSGDEEKEQEATIQNLRELLKTLEAL